MAQTVCDIQFVLPACSTSAQTDTVTPDGAIAVLATASGVATIKYYLIAINAGGGGGGGGSDFDYDTQGQTSGVFSGLVYGSYRVIARNSNSCKAEADFTVALSDDLTYGIRFTNRYYGFRENGYTPAYWKIDIKNRNYSGPTEEVKMSFSVIQGVAGVEDPFQTIFPSAVNVELLADTDGQFEELYTEDDREFMVVIYLHDGSDWDVWWVGYGVTGEYSAPYDTLNNTPITFRAADMLENLRQIPFGNENGDFPQVRMSIMDGILMALQRTDIELDIYEGIQYVIDGVSNTFDETSAVEEAYFDPLIYFNNGEAESCYDVLDSLLKCMSARLYQAEGRWNIESVTMKSGGTFNVRTRDFDGEETGAGYLETEPRLLVRKSGAPGERLVFQDRTQAHKIAQTYGNIDVIFDYGMKESNNILVASDFEDVDAANGQFVGWSFDDFNSFADITPSQVTVGEREKVLQLDFRQTGTGTHTIQGILAAQTVELVAPVDPYVLNVSFDVRGFANNTDAYLYFDYRVYLEVSGTKYYLQPTFYGALDSTTVFTLNNQTPASDDDGFIRKYIEHDTWTTVELNITGFTASGQAGTLGIDYVVYSNGVFDVDTIDDPAGLRDVVTTGAAIQRHANRRRVHYTSGGADSIYQYELVPGDDADDSPNVVRPDDYASNSPWYYVWKLLSRIPPVDQGTEPHITPWCQFIQFHNVVVKYLPDNTIPDESTTYSAIVNGQTRQDLEFIIRHADIPTDHNYQNISRGWLSFSDGTPTNGRWKLRPATAGPNTQRRPLIQRVSTHLRGQYIARRWKETGTFSTMRKVPSFFNTFYEVRTGKVFVPLYMRVDSKNASCDIEMIEVIQGTAIADSGVIDPVNPDIPIEPPPEEAGRIHVAAFATAFY